MAVHFLKSTLPNIHSRWVALTKAVGKELLPFQLDQMGMQVMML
jgi:hypothetical protein